MRAKNKTNFTKEELADSGIMIYVTLFDQTIREERLTPNHKHTYYENVYLGEITIPLSSVLSG